MVLDIQRETPPPTEVLIPEARKHQKQRYVRTGIVAVVCALIVAGLIVGAVALFGGPSAIGKAKTSPRPPAVAGAPGAVLLRPVLCYAPLYSASASKTVTAGPSCAAPYALTAAGLDVQPKSGADAANGFISNNVGPDPALAAYPSSGRDVAGSTVLLGAPRGDRNERVLLGPAAMKLSASDVSSAAVRETQQGVWEVDIRLTPAGAAKWDSVAEMNFHLLLAFEQGGRVISVPLMQPAQSSFSSFDGAMQVSGGLTKQDATSLALATKARS
jgi:hypothetical protein